MLVNEAWLRLHQEGCVELTWQNRRHFFGAVSRALTQILIDYARTRNRKKRGGSKRPAPLHLVPGELGFSENIQDDQLGPNKGSNTFCANLPEHIFGPYTDDGKNEFEDECLIDCNENGIDDLDDNANGTSQDCNGNGIPDECDLDSGSSID